jgi:LmbE family N-acetylglucosaminyl deacetylase
MTTLVCAAHADDEVIGLGGTIAKLAKTEDVVVVIFFYGADLAGRLFSWPPWLSEEKLTKKRVYESQKACDFLGVKETVFLGLKSSAGMKTLDESRKHLLTNLIQKYKPDKVFYHSIKDGHPDHLLVHKTMEELVSKMEKKPEVYMYQINLFDFSQKEPKIIFDISDVFHKKLKALEFFKTQLPSVAPLKLLILLKAIYFGRMHNMKYAEYFFAE